MELMNQESPIECQCTVEEVSLYIAFQVRDFVTRFGLYPSGFYIGEDLLQSLKVELHELSAMPKGNFYRLEKFQGMDVFADPEIKDNTIRFVVDHRE